jgi:hypothetical protein
MATNASELFIVDNSDSDWKVRSYLKDWCELSRAIDIATGYFEIGALLTLEDKWQSVEKIRILMGDEVSLRTKRAFVQGLQKINERLFVEIKDGSSQFPLYRYTELEDSLFATKGGRTPNLSEPIVAQWFARLGVTPTWIAEKSKTTESAIPEDIFHYAYAVLHSPGYRSRYAGFLKIDFPRLPLTGSLELFRALAQLGSELVALHLLESPKLNNFITHFEGDGDNSIPKKPIYKDGAVWINASQRFEGVPEVVWNFHVGGYQVCEKWLKDRKGRTLSADDITHYQRVVVALNETIRLMAEIDEVIEAHGGWPGAFQTAAETKVPA